MARERSSAGRVRIIGGRWRGRRVAFPGLEGLRPTPDRVRETVFNWLTPFIDGARVLDLFAGSGALGFEALSRGAASATAVDSDARVVAQLRTAAAELDAALTAVAADARAFVSALAAGPFDVVFLDPPHAAADYEGLCRRLDTGSLMAPGALVYVEFSTPRASSFAPPATWERYRSSRAGGLTYQLWRRPGGAQPE